MALREFVQLDNGCRLTHTHTRSQVSNFSQSPSCTNPQNNKERSAGVFGAYSTEQRQGTHHLRTGTFGQSTGSQLLPQVHWAALSSHTVLNLFATDSRIAGHHSEAAKPSVMAIVKLSMLVQAHSLVGCFRVQASSHTSLQKRLC